MFQGIGIVEKYNNEANLILRWNFNKHRRYYQWLICRELLYKNTQNNNQGDQTTN